MLTIERDDFVLTVIERHGQVRFVIKESSGQTIIARVPLQNIQKDLISSEPFIEVQCEKTPMQHSITVGTLFIVQKERALRFLSDEYVRTVKLTKDEWERVHQDILCIRTQGA